MVRTGGRGGVGGLEGEGEGRGEGKEWREREGREGEGGWKRLEMWC